MTKYRNHPFFRALQNYVTFFLLVAVMVSCCMVLFVTTLADSMGLVFTEENMAEAAKLTFGCVILIAFVSASIDYIRRKLMVDGRSSGSWPRWIGSCRGILPCGSTR